VDDAATDALLAVKLCNVSIPIYKGNFIFISRSVKTNNQ